MQRATLPEVRNSAIAIGPVGVLSLLIAEGTYSPAPPTPPLYRDWWWWALLVIFLLCSLVGIFGFVAPNLHGLRFRRPWYQKDDAATVEGAPLAPALRSDAITEAQEKIVQEVAPIATSYRATAKLRMALLVFAVRMDNAIASIPRGSTEAWVAAIDPLNYEFLHNSLPGLVQHKERLKSGFGLIRSELSDEALTLDFYGPKDIRKLAFGLELMLDDLSRKIVEKASEL